MIKTVLKMLFTISLLFFVSTSTLHAADLSVGATAWYTAWGFDWDGSADISYDPGFLYGPVLSLSMTPDFSLSFVFLYGNFDQTVSAPGYTNTTDIVRYDSDLTLNYRLNDYFKIFAGVKFIRFTWDPGGKHEAVGPGIGVSTIVPLGNSFFLLGYISGLYLMGNEVGDSSLADQSVKEYGGNASMSVAYYISSTSTTISLGGRYQYVKILYEDQIADVQEDSISQFYGVTLSAIYSFNI